METGIYNFSNPIEFVSRQFSSKKEKNPSFSLRAWARQLGFENPSLLSSILKGQRRLQITLAQRIGQNLKLDPKEKKYFELLVLTHNAKNEAERMMYSEMLGKLRPRSAQPIFSLQLDAFRYISDWFHLGILELIDTKNFKYDNLEIAKRLGKGLTAPAVAGAIERLIRLGLVQESSDQGRPTLKRVHAASLVLDPNTASDAIKFHHEQILGFAGRALHVQDVATRDFRSTMIPLKAADFSAAQKIIQKAHNELLKLAADPGEGDEVYDLSTQFFRISETAHRRGAK